MDTQGGMRLEPLPDWYVDFWGWLIVVMPKMGHNT